MFLISKLFHALFNFNLFFSFSAARSSYRQPIPSASVFETLTERPNISSTPLNSSSLTSNEISNTADLLRTPEGKESFEMLFIL